MARPVRSRSRRKSSGSALSLKLLGGVKTLFLFCLPYIFTLGVVGLVFGGVAAYAMNSATFRLQEVYVQNVGTMSQDEAFEFCELKEGENLVTLDLVAVQQVIKKKHPQFKDVIVQRILPNRIDVILRRRTPIAQIAFSRYVQIDQDLVILPGSSETPFKNLTIIEGTKPPRGGPAVGVQISESATRKAVKLAELIRRSGVLGKSELTKMDVRDPKNFSFYVDGDIEIKIGGSHFMERLKLLGQTLKTINLDKTKIRYIDLRFDDVVVGPR